ncbi:MAG: type II toxin-antitoxin system VapC family toxin [Actinomycetota bacterium]|jgi:predicted nucleic acid-binding protein|nr:VapC toxin family PIN domain ribonuclease [Actinomycetota bacterium]
MILVDTSVWIGHLGSGNSALVRVLEAGLVLGHPWVVGELALGRLVQRHEVIRLLGSLPQASIATPEEVMALIDLHQLPGQGIGYVDAQLLAATLLTAGAALWTFDRALADAAYRLGRGIDPEDVGSRDGGSATEIR